MSSAFTVQRTNLAADPTTSRRWRAFGLAALAVFSAGAIAYGTQLWVDQPTTTSVVAADTTLTASEVEPIRPEAHLTGQLRNARIAAATARRQADAAELALFQFLNAKVEDLTATAAVAPVVVAPAPVVVVPANIKPKPAPVDPKWIELHQQLQEFTVQRDKLLEKLTPAHPTVREIQEQIDQTQARLAALPPPARNEESVVAVDSTVATKIDPATQRHEAGLPGDGPQLTDPEMAGMPRETPTAKPTSPTANDSREWRQKYRELMQAAGLARKDYSSADTQETASWLALQSAIAAAPSRQIAAAQPAVAAENTASIPWPGIGVLASLSVFAGIIAAARIRRPAPMFETFADVETSLRLPILGRLENDATARQRGNAA